MQSQTFGPAYLLGFALPSVARASLYGLGLVGGDYDNFYTERNATQRGKKYFDKTKGIIPKKSGDNPSSRMIKLYKTKTACIGSYDEIPLWLRKPK